MLSAPVRAYSSATADEHRVAGDAVGDREVDRALDRGALLDPVGGERVRHGAHQLEEDDQVEQIAGQAEPDHRPPEQQHERVKQAVDGVEVAQRVDQRRDHQHAANIARPAPSGSIESEIPIVTPWLGRQPPIQ